MTIFRPCIDLHSGQVKQIVGASLSDSPDDQLKTNFVSSHSPSFYANLYREHGLSGAHVIMLGPGNDQAATEALNAWPQGLQLGGGINLENAQTWLDKGASKIIVTSFLFPSGKLDIERLQELSGAIGKELLVIDLRLVFVMDKDSDRVSYRDPI
jgi:phosphoribosylformimino-5-aminoimidazole carboxamide ribotide isomerase